MPPSHKSVRKRFSVGSYSSETKHRKSMENVCRHCNLKFGNLQAISLAKHNPYNDMKFDMVRNFCI